MLCSVAGRTDNGNLAGRPTRPPDMAGLRRSAVRVVVLVAAAGLATGCSSTTTSPGRSALTTSAPASSVPASTVPVATPSPTSGASQDALIYAAVLGGHSDTASGLRRVVYLRDMFCAGMIDIGKRGPCTAGPIPMQLRHELVRLVGPGLHITANPPMPDPRYSTARIVVVQLGSINRVGSTARVAVDWQCGSLCGHGETVVLGKQGGSWIVTGHSRSAWIS